MPCRKSEDGIEDDVSEERVSGTWDAGHGTHDWTQDMGEGHGTVNRKPNY